MTWRVSEFIPEKHFGFCNCDDPAVTEAKVFFHVRDFIRLVPGEPGPVLGEEVLVSKIEAQSRGPCARLVHRKSSPALLRGTVLSYSTQRMWGFILGEDQRDYYFHKKELLGSWIPLQGSPVLFSSGNVEGKDRACWVCLRRK